MPRPKGIGKGPTQQFSVRLDKETAAFYRKQANVHGMNIAEFFRYLLVQGVIAENVREIETRLQHPVDEMRARAPGYFLPVLPHTLSYVEHSKYVPHK